MEEDNLIKLFNLTSDAIFYLALRIRPEDVINFFESYPEFDYLLKDEYFLKVISEYNNVPTITNLKELVKYSRMSIQ